MKADFNDRVKVGDLLAVIDRAPYAAKLASGRANLDMARAEIGMRESAIARAETQLIQDQRHAARFEVLSPRGGIAKTTRRRADAIGPGASRSRYGEGAIGTGQGRRCPARSRSVESANRLRPHADPLAD